MSNPEILPPSPDLKAQEPHSQGPSLKLLYALVVVALAAAIGLALLIVMPFYRRR
jgi:hypothetical protein